MKDLAVCCIVRCGCEQKCKNGTGSLICHFQCGHCDLYLEILGFRKKLASSALTPNHKEDSPIVSGKSVFELDSDDDEVPGRRKHSVERFSRTHSSMISHVTKVVPLGQKKLLFRASTELGCY